MCERFYGINGYFCNPASNFFDKPVIQSENTEISTIYSQSTNPGQRYVESLLVKRNNLTNFGELLIPSTSSTSSSQKRQGFYAAYPASKGMIYYRRFDMYLFG
jgi:hypothetical protein